MLRGEKIIGKILQNEIWDDIQEEQILKHGRDTQKSRGGGGGVEVESFLENEMSDVVLA